MAENRANITVSLNDKATLALNKIKLSAQGITNSFNGFVGAAKKSAATLAGIGAGAAGLTYFAKNANDAARKIDDLSGRYQVDSKLLQLAGALVAESGGSFEDAASSLGKLKKAMWGAQNGDKEMAEAFKGVGISITELKNMSPDEVLMRMADAFKGSDKDMAKQAVLLKTMGKNGETMMNALNQGAEGWREQNKKMIEDGRYFTAEQLKQSAQFDAAWNRVTGSLTGIKNALGLKLAQAILPVINRFREWLNVNREMIKGKFEEFLKNLPVIMETIGKVAKTAFKAFGFFVGIISKIAGMLGAEGSTWATFALIIGNTAFKFLGLAANVVKFISPIAKLALPALKILGYALGIAGRAVLFIGRALMMNPIGLAITAIAGAGYLIYKNWDKIKEFFAGIWTKIKSYFDGGISEIGATIANWSPLGLFYKAIRPVLEWFGVELPENFSEFGSGLITKFVDSILETFQKIKGKITGIADSVKSFFGFGDAPELPDTPNESVLYKMTKGTNAVTPAANAAATMADAQKQKITNDINIKIDSEGRPTVTDQRSQTSGTEGKNPTKINVKAGYAMATG